MSACTFFGHRDCPSSIKPKLREVLIDLIENRAVDMFYVGQQGVYDAIVRSVLKELVSVYPHIRYAVVLEANAPELLHNEYGGIPLLTLLEQSAQCHQMLLAGQRKTYLQRGSQSD